VIRDGRDVVCSLLQMEWVDPTTGQQLECTTDVAAAARYWVETVQVGRSTAEHPTAAQRYHEVRYEDLVADPEVTLGELFEVVDEPFDPCVLEFHRQPRDLAGESSAGQVARPIHGGAVGRWRRQLSKEEQGIVEEIAGELLRQLGYERRVPAGE